MTKNQHDQILDFVTGSNPEELTDIIQSLLHGTRAGIAGMEGRNWLSNTTKPRSKKAAIESALSYCKAVNSEVSKKMF